ncbi:MAG: winged helix-turn-helix domain-containing protein, partial [Myxococcota bacterium]
MGLLLVTIDSDGPRREALVQQLRAAGHAVVVYDGIDEVDPLLRPDATVIGPGVPESSLLGKLGPGVRVLVLGPAVGEAIAGLARTTERDLLWLDGAAVDLRQQRAVRDEGVERLTDMEASLLAWLAAHPGEVVTRESLLVNVWGYRAETATRTVDNTVRRLRRKVERDPARPTHITTVHGEGYRFVAPVAATDAPPELPPGLLGRDAEVAELVEQATAHRLVTVLGPAGIGKTTLMSGLLARRPAAVFVDLTPARIVADVEGRTA